MLCPFASCHLGLRMVTQPTGVQPPRLQKDNHAMQYNDTIDDSRQYLRLTLELIGKHGLSTDPLNYCIWYEYASGRNQALNAAIDKHMESSGAFSEEISRQLFYQHIAKGQETVTTLVREELKKVFTEIISA